MDSEVHKVVEDLIIGDIRDVDFIKVNTNLGYDIAKNVATSGLIVQSSNLVGTP